MYISTCRCRCLFLWINVCFLVGQPLSLVFHLSSLIPHLSSLIPSSLIPHPSSLPSSLSIYAGRVIDMAALEDSSEEEEEEERPAAGAKLSAMRNADVSDGDSW